MPEEESRIGDEGRGRGRRHEERKKRRVGDEGSAEDGERLSLDDLKREPRSWAGGTDDSEGESSNTEERSEVPDKRDHDRPLSAGITLKPFSSEIASLATFSSASLGRILNRGDTIIAVDGISRTWKETASLLERVGDPIGEKLSLLVARQHEQIHTHVLLSPKDRHEALMKLFDKLELLRTLQLVQASTTVKFAYDTFGNIVVDKVSDKSTAIDCSEVLKNDKVISINQVDVDGLALDQVKRIFQESADVVCRFVLERDGNEVEARIKRSPQYAQKTINEICDMIETMEKERLSDLMEHFARSKDLGERKKVRSEFVPEEPLFSSQQHSESIFSFKTPSKATRFTSFKDSKLGHSQTKGKIVQSLHVELECENRRQKHFRSLVVSVLKQWNWFTQTSFRWKLSAYKIVHLRRKKVLSHSFEQLFIIATEQRVRKRRSGKAELHRSSQRVKQALAAWKNFHLENLLRFKEIQWISYTSVKMSRALGKFKTIRLFSAWAAQVEKEGRAIKICYHMERRRASLLLKSVLRGIADLLVRVKAKYHGAYVLHVLWTRRRMRALFDAFRVKVTEVKQRQVVTEEELAIARGFEALRGRHNFLFTGLGRKVSQRLWEGMVIRRTQQQLKLYVAKVNVRMKADLLRQTIIRWYHHTFAAVRQSFKLNSFLGLRLKRQLLTILMNWLDMVRSNDRLLARFGQMLLKRTMRVKSRVMFIVAEASPSLKARSQIKAYLSLQSGDLSTTTFSLARVRPRSLEVLGKSVTFESWKQRAARTRRHVFLDKVLDLSSWNKTKLSLLSWKFTVFTSFASQGVISQKLVSTRMARAFFRWFAHTRIILAEIYQNSKDRDEQDLPWSAILRRAYEEDPSLVADNVMRRLQDFEERKLVFRAQVMEYGRT